MREIHTHIRFVVSIIEIVHPATFVRIDIHDTGMKEIPWSAKLARDGLVHDLAFLGDVGRIFGYHDHFVGIDLYIGVTHAGCRVQVVFAKGSRRIVVPFVTVDHLFRVQRLFAGHRIDGIDAFDCPDLVFIGTFPGNRTAPIQMRGNRFAVSIFGNLKQVIAAISRVGQTLADNGIAHPIHELAVFGIRHLCLVHPESIERDAFRFRIDPPQGILICGSHLE